VSFRMGISEVGPGAITFAVDALNEHTIYVSSLHGKRHDTYSYKCAAGIWFCHVNSTMSSLCPTLWCLPSWPLLR
jgi:hypothetical protein